MLAAYVSAVLICLGSLATGQAALNLCGRGGDRLLAPAVGLALLLVVTRVAIRFPGHAVTSAVALTLLFLGAVVVLMFGSQERQLPRPGAVAPALAAVLAVAAVSIPFAVHGGVGVLGMGLVNDDMASHLLFTDWLITHLGPTPDLVGGGYPLGPHALVAAIAEISSASVVEAFAGLSLGLAALAALTSYGALDGVRTWLRVPASVLAALPYMAVAYLAQGAFKEPMFALFVVAFALGMPGLRGASRRGLAAIPLGLIAAGTLYAYSFPGLAWLAGTALIWAVAIAVRERDERGGLDLGGRVGRARPAIGGVLACTFLAALPELGSLISFTDFRAFDPQGSGPRIGLGNLRQPLTPLEGLGIWPSSEFRISASTASSPELAFYLGALVAAAALAWGLLRALLRGEVALPAALGAAGLGYLAAIAVGTPYTSAKALAIAAPVVMLISLRGLLLGMPVFGAERATAGDRDELHSTTLRRLRPFRIPLAVLFVLAAALSSFLPLRGAVIASVGPGSHASELSGLRPLIGERPVLFLGRESFVASELLGARVAGPVINNYNVKTVPARYPTTADRAKFDFDSVTPRILDTFPFVITTRAAYLSRAPQNFRRVRITPDYALWKRFGETPARRVLDERGGPGAVLDCAKTPPGSVAAPGSKLTVSDVAPVSGPEAAWMPTPHFTDSTTTSQLMKLSAGRWALSLQYISTRTVHIEGPGLDRTLPANLDFRGPSAYWPAGQIVVPKDGVVTITLSVERPPLLGRLLGGESTAFAGPIAATPLGAAGAEHRVSPAQACGRYVDYISPG